MAECNIAWAAGFIEGEGHIGISVGYHKNRTSPNPISRLILEVSNTDIRGLRKLQDIFGGNIAERKYKTRRARIFRWVVTSENAIHCLKAIRPYCCFKNDQIAIAIEFQKTTKRRGCGVLLDAETIVYRKQLCEQIRLLTRRGIDKMYKNIQLPTRKPIIQEVLL